MKNAICSIVSNNYFSQVITLGKSIRKVYSNDIDFYVMIVDDKDNKIDYSACQGDVHFITELGIDNLNYYAMKYNVIEFNTFVKPFFIKHLFRKHNKVVYLDPDIEIFEKLDDVYLQLDKYDMVLTPHRIVKDETDDEEYKDMLKSGYFNLGFCALNASETGNKIVDLWANDLKQNCYSDNYKHLFTDQKSVANLFYVFYKNIFVDTDAGKNVAPWNFCERKIEKHGEKFFVALNGQDSTPLIFFHYSGFNVHGGDVFFNIKHQDFNLKGECDMVKLLESYRERILLNGYDELRQIKYKYNFFDNGRYVSRFERKIYDEMVKNRIINTKDDPFLSNSHFYILLKKNKLLTSNKIMANDLSGKNVLKKGSYGKKEKMVKFFMRSVKKVLGTDNYSLLLRYLPYAVRIENQNYLIKKKK